MAYGLCRINKDGTHNGIRYSLDVGTVIECPDWNFTQDQDSWIMLLPHAQGLWDMICGHYWVVIEYDPTDLVMIGEEMGKVPRCKIVEIQEPDVLNPDKLLSYFDHSMFSPLTAFFWALHIGNRDIMIEKITDSFGAALWGGFIGDRDVMIDKVTDSRWSAFWGFHIGDRDIMKHRITDSEDAYNWAVVLGDRDIMKPLVTDSEWVSRWNEQFPDDQIEMR